MNIIKVKELGTSCTEEIIQNLAKFKVNEDNRFVKFFEKEVPLNEVGKLSDEKNIFLGDSHELTFPVIKGLKTENLGVIIFDAHADCIDDDDLVPSLVRLLGRQNVVLVGLRNKSAREIEFLKENNIRFFSMKEISREGNFETSEALMSIARGFGSLYISVDADVLDPAFVSVDCPEPGGFSVRELLYFLQRMKLVKSFKAADLCELKKDPLVGAKIISELF